MQTNQTDAWVIRRSMTDPDAFATIFDRYFDAIHAYLARRTGRDGADGLAGEVFRIAFENRAGYQSERPHCLPWLYGIAGNVLRQHRRTAHRQMRLADRAASVRPMEPDDPADGVGRGDGIDDVLRIVDALPAADRETVLLFAWEQLTYEQIAAALAVPVGTVRSRLNRARQRIREQMALAGQEPGDTHPRAERRCRP